MKIKLLVLLSILPAFLFAQVKYNDRVVTEDLVSQLDEISNGELIDVNIRLKEQFPIADFYPTIRSKDKSAIREIVISELKSFSKTSQKDLISYLNKQQGQAEIKHELWIVNVVSCKLTKAVIFEISNRNDVERIDWDEEQKMIEDQAILDPSSAKGTDEVTYNVLKVKADEVWALGFHGEGVIVSVLDTGVNYNHSDLSDHMWEDPDFPNHGYDFHNNDNDPMDDHGHGTHCSGTIAGDGTAGSQTGMAPEARIMALKVLSSGGSGQESSVWTAIQFAVDHGANVMSLSIGWTHSSNPDREAWRTSMNNALAAGLIASVAAGNETGSITNPDDVRTPGDCPPPWLNPDQTLIGGLSAVVCIGATDANDNIAYFSSLGPSDWSAVNSYNDYPFNPEMGLLRPDVSAPGVDVKSCDAFNVNGYTYMSGTSMATPGVAGVMALLLSKNIQLSPADINMALENTAVELGAPGKDNIFGSGRVDALEAFNAVNFPGPSYFAHTINDASGNGEIEAGENVQLSIEMWNGNENPFSNVMVTLSTDSPYLTFTDNTELYGNFAPDQYINIVDGFDFDMAANTPGNETVVITVFATDGTEEWTTSFDLITYGPSISFDDVSIDDSNTGNSNGRLDPGETADLMIKVVNGGQVEINDVLSEISSSSSFVTINNADYLIATIGGGAEVYAIFNITIDSETAIGSVVDFHFEMNAGELNDMKDVSLMVGLIVEDWESNDFEQFEWEFSGNEEWDIFTNNPYEGNYSAGSKDINDSQTAGLELNADIISDGDISFYYKVSSESNYDYLRFYIDGVLQGEWAGTVPWAYFEYPVSAGNHTFLWAYEKDYSVSNGDDMAWIDFIEMPPMNFDAMTQANAGNDASVCTGSNYTLNGSGANYNTLEWTTSGDGNFDDVTILNPTYTPGSNDETSGSVILTLNAYGDNGDVSDEMMLTINIFPIVYISEDLTICEGQDAEFILSFEGEAPWTITFNSGSTLNIPSSPYTYIVTPDENTTYTIVNVTDANCGGDVNVEFSVEVNSLPMVDLGEDMDLCLGQPIDLDAENTGSSYLWSTGEETQVITVDSTGMDNDNNKLISVEVTNIENCVASDEILLHFYQCVGINENVLISSFNIYPVPNNGSFRLSFYSEKKQDGILKIVNLLGAVIYQEEIEVTEGQYTRNIQLTDAVEGVYYLVVETAEGVISKKISIVE